MNAYLLSALTWDCTKIKMKTYTWNSSVALLSPTCSSWSLTIKRRKQAEVELCQAMVTIKHIMWRSSEIQNVS